MLVTDRQSEQTRTLGMMLSLNKLRVILSVIRILMIRHLLRKMLHRVKMAKLFPPLGRKLSRPIALMLMFWLRRMSALMCWYKTSQLCSPMGSQGLLTQPSLGS